MVTATLALVLGSIVLLWIFLKLYYRLFWAICPHGHILLIHGKKDNFVPIKAIRGGGERINPFKQTYTTLSDSPITVIAETGKIQTSDGKMVELSMVGMCTYDLSNPIEKTTTERVIKDEKLGALFLEYANNPILAHNDAKRVIKEQTTTLVSSTPWDEVKDRDSDFYLDQANEPDSVLRKLLTSALEEYGMELINIQPREIKT